MEVTMHVQRKRAYYLTLAATMVAIIGLAVLVTTDERLQELARPAIHIELNDSGTANIDLNSINPVPTVEVVPPANQPRSSQVDVVQDAGRALLLQTALNELTE